MGINDIFLKKRCETMFCRKCGAKIPSDSLFCPKCGKQTEQQQWSEQEKAQNNLLPPRNKEPLAVNDQNHILISNLATSSIQEEPHTCKECFFSLFKFSGRISKKRLIKNLFIALPVVIILYIVGFLFVKIVDGIIGREILVIDLLVPVLFPVIPFLSISVRRMRDAGIPLYLLPICLCTMCFFDIASFSYSMSSATIASSICTIASYLIFFVLLFFMLLPSKTE